MQRFRHRFWVTFFTVALVLSCSGAPTEVAREPISLVVIDPEEASIHVGSNITLTAFALDTAGRPQPSRRIFWASSNEAIATVNGTGVVSGKTPGQVQIAASAEGKSAIARITVTPPPVATVTVSPESAEMFVGATLDLTATPRDAAGNTLSERPVTWSSSAPAVAEVSSSGRVTARAPGQATITATSEGRSGTASITVRPVPVASVTLSPGSITLVPDQTQQMTVVLRDAAGNVLTGRAVAWSTSSGAVATVSGSGLVRAVAPGIATITATSEGRSGTATVTVIPRPVDRVTVTAPSNTLRVGDQMQLTARVYDAQDNELTGRPITWTSSNNAVATVNSTGVVTGVSPGSVTITATSEGKSGSVSLAVTLRPVDRVEVTAPSSQLQAGMQMQLTARTYDSQNNELTGRAITWSSSSSAIATVNSTGRVTGVSPGSVTVTATSEGKSGGVSLTVTQVPVATVTVAPSTATIPVGATVALAATARAADGTVLTGRPVSWSSSNNSVATVSGSGVVTGAAAGTATITATVEGKSGTATVTVNAPAPPPPPPGPGPIVSVEVTPSSVSLSARRQDTVQMTARAYDAQGNQVTGQPVTWSSSNNSVAAVSPTGLVSAISPGNATITARIGGVNGTATVSVNNSP